MQKGPRVSQELQEGPAVATGRVAAFFDLDRTLIDVNSAILWARSERRDKVLSVGQLARALYWTALYHLSMVNIEATFAAALAHYRDREGEWLDKRTVEWFKREVLHRLRPGAAPILEMHRAQGHHLVLLTSSSIYAARAAAEAWGFDDWIANRFLLDERGRLVGICESPLCFGPGKVTRAEAWAKEHDVSLEDSYFYSDSFTDLPMLERVGHPRIVAPDPRLKRVARKRGWPILNW